MLRILHGFGFGAEWAVGAVLLGELVAPAHRGKALGAVQSAAGPGSMMAALLAGPIAAALPMALGWRVAFFIGVLPAVLVFFVRQEGDDADISLARAPLGERGTACRGDLQAELRRLTALACLLALGLQGAGFAAATTPPPSCHRAWLSLECRNLCAVQQRGGFFAFSPTPTS